MPLPREIGVAAFDALHDDLGAWRDAVEAIARPHGDGPVEQIAEGTALVVRLGSTRIFKLYPPFLRDHFEFERAMLGRLHGRLAVPTPELIAHGEHGGWPYLVMTQLAGEPLTARWPVMREAQRCALLESLGALAAQVHGLPVGEIAALAPPWPVFIARQRERCVERQRRTGLPAHLLEQVPAFIAGPLPDGPAVLLTGEYTPFNLFVRDDRLAAMFDFGDGLVGPREYDWLGPLCFLAAGHADRVSAFLRGYGVAVDGAGRIALMRLLLLHRYSHLPAQIAYANWQRAPSFEALVERIWCAG
jgi:hygromycin-B 7''-O-kinase